MSLRELRGVMRALIIGLAVWTTVAWTIVTLADGRLS